MASKITKIASTATTIIGGSNTINITGNLKLRVKSVHFCNDTGSAETIQVYFVPNGGTATNGADGNKISSDYAMASKAEGVLDVGEMILEAGDSLQAVGTTGDLVNVVVTYEIVPVGR